MDRLRSIVLVVCLSIWGVVATTGGAAPVTTPVRQGEATATATRPPNGERLLLLYVLAFDNCAPGETCADHRTNLTPSYTTVLAGIVAATAADPLKTAVLLVDLDTVGDTHVRVAQNGSVFSVAGLPNVSGQLDTTITEYDSTDGPTLGGFMRWARTQYPAPRTVLSVIGHGAPLVPETAMENIFVPATLRGTQGRSSTLIPLPTRVDANPDVTDHHMPLTTTYALSALTPVALGEALRIGTNNGQQPFQVVDLLMCFAASIEDFYQIAPYTAFATGSPSYAFFDPTMVGVGAAALSASMNAATLAATLVQTYDDQLPAADHPRILVAVDTSRLASVKTAWDAAASGVHAELIGSAAQRTQARQRLVNAYQAALKYDTTGCSPQDLNLVTPDALVDMAHFATQLARQWPAQSPIAINATLTQERIRNSVNPAAIVTRRAVNAVPWFDTTVPTSTWLFNGTSGNTLDDAAGLSLYADFVGITSTTSISTELSFHAHWYRDDNPSGDNPQPYAFLSDGSSGAGWDEVFQEFWAGLPTTTATCTPPFPTARAPGELSIAVEQPLVGTLTVNKPMSLTARLNSSSLVINPLVRFAVLQNGTTIFSETVSAGEVITGTQRIAARRAFTPSATGSLLIRVSADTDNRIIEPNETNNTAQVVRQVGAVPRPRFSAALPGNRQWWSEANIPLLLTAEAGLEAQLYVQVYQYPLDSSTPTRAPQLVSVQNLPITNNRVTVDGAALRPGPVIIQLWPRTGNTILAPPAVVRFNYVPLNASFGPERDHWFLFHAQRGDNVALTLQLQAGEADLWLWEPYNRNRPALGSTLQGNDALIFKAPLTGLYPVLVRRDVAATTYTLQATRNSAPLRTALRPVAAPSVHLLFLDAPLELPDLTATPTATPTPSVTSVPPSATFTNTPTRSATATSSSTATTSATRSPTAAPTASATTSVGTPTATVTPSPSLTPATTPTVPAALNQRMYIPFVRR